MSEVFREVLADPRKTYCSVGWSVILAHCYRCPVITIRMIRIAQVKYVIFRSVVAFRRHCIYAPLIIGVVLRLTMRERCWR